MRLAPLLSCGSFDPYTVPISGGFSLTLLYPNPYFPKNILVLSEIANYLKPSFISKIALVENPLLGCSLIVEY